MESLIENGMRRYFAETLGSDGKAKYLSFELDDGAKDAAGRSADYLSGKINYEKNGVVCKSQSLFLKLMRDSRSTIMNEIAISKGFLSITFCHEMMFYSVIKPFFDSFKPMDDLLPKFHAVNLNATVEHNFGALLFDNLRNSEYSGCKHSRLDYEHLSLLMRKLGQFHSYSFYAKKKNPIQFFGLTSCFTEVNAINPDIDKGFLRQRFATALKPLQSDSRYSAGLNQINNMVEDLEGILKEHMKTDKSDKMMVLTHRACRSDNILFRYKNDKPIDLKLLDWQTCKMTYLTSDILLALFVEASHQIRENHWNNLIDEYYVGLSEMFPDNDIPSKEDVKKELKKRLPSVLLMLAQKFYTTKPLPDADPVTDIIRDVILRL